MCKSFDTGASHSFSNVMKRSQEPRLIGELGQSPNSNDNTYIISIANVSN